MLEFESNHSEHHPAQVKFLTVQIMFSVMFFLPDLSQRTENGNHKATDEPM